MPAVFDKHGLRVVRKLYLRHQRFATALCQSLRNSSGELFRNTAASYYALFSNVAPILPIYRSSSSSSSNNPPSNIDPSRSWLCGHLNTDHLRHAQVPGGVLMPPGLSQAARKFHSHTVSRHPAALVGLPSAKGLGNDEDRKLEHIRPSGAASSSLSTSTTDYDVYGLNGRNGGQQWSSASKKAKPTSYMFSHSAAGIPKNASKIPLGQGKDVVNNRGEPELSTGSGEDAFFHRSDAMGVADGVGGWSGDPEADAGLFARRLMHYAHKEISRFDDIDDEMFVRYDEASPVDILRQAYEMTLDDFRSLELKGSSTACIVLLRDDELRVANLGDCGITVVRHGDMIFRTEEQQHSFNFPYQLGTGEYSDKPTDAQIFRLKVRKGDIVIVGSDGLFDNLFDEDILEEVNRLLPPTYRADGGSKLKANRDTESDNLNSQNCDAEASLSSGTVTDLAKSSGSAPPSKQGRTRLGFSLPQFHIDPKAISDAIAYRAKYVSEENRYVSSPFQTRAIQEGLYYQGGKRDDISVVVAIITDLEDSPDRRL